MFEIYLYIVLNITILRTCSVATRILNLATTSKQVYIYECAQAFSWDRPKRLFSLVNASACLAR